MKVILVNGSPRENGCTNRALTEVSRQLNSHGIQTEIFQLSRGVISGCIACGSCYKSGKCFKDDKVNELAELLSDCDGLVFGSPVYYAGMSGQLKCFMDRLFYSRSSLLTGKPACAVVSCRRGGASSAFDDINKYFLINNMPVVPSQYWNQVHGTTPEEVEEDKEGLQTMRTLGDNMAWMLKCIEAGKANGIALPQREPRQRTNFIR